MKNFARTPQEYLDKNARREFRVRFAIGAILGGVFSVWMYFAALDVSLSRAMHLSVFDASVAAACLIGGALLGGLVCARVADRAWERVLRSIGSLWP